MRVIEDVTEPYSDEISHVADSKEVLRPIHTERVYVRLRPSTRVDGRRRAQNRTVLDFERVYVRRRT